MFTLVMLVILSLFFTIDATIRFMDGIDARGFGLIVVNAILLCLLLIRSTSQISQQLGY